MAGLGSLFVPAYQAGNRQSTDTVDQWMAANFSMTNPKVEQTRRPAGFNTGNPAGMVDPEALRVLAQGGPYDMDARRSEIAAAVAAQQAAAAAPAQLAAPAGMPGYNGDWASMTTADPGPTSAARSAYPGGPQMNYAPLPPSAYYGSG